MNNRSELRYACYSAKKGIINDNIKNSLDVIAPLLTVGQNWSNFSVVWDIIISRPGDVKIIKPETDYDYIHSTLIEAALYKKQGISLDTFSDRQLGIIDQVSTLMVDGLMSLENYNKNWGISVDPDLKQIKTRLYNVKKTQIEVTDAMIEASKKDADGSALSNQQTNVLEAVPMDAAKMAAFEQFLAKQYKDNK